MEQQGALKLEWCLLTLKQASKLLEIDSFFYIFMKEMSLSKQLHKQYDFYTFDRFLTSHIVNKAFQRHILTDIVWILIKNCSYKGDSFIEKKVFHLSALSHSNVVINIYDGGSDHDIFFPYHRKIFRLTERVIKNLSF